MNVRTVGAIDLFGRLGGDHGGGIRADGQCDIEPVAADQTAGGRDQGSQGQIAGARIGKQDPQRIMMKQAGQPGSAVTMFESDFGAAMDGEAWRSDGG